MEVKKNIVKVYAVAVSASRHEQIHEEEDEAAIYSEQKLYPLILKADSIEEAKEKGQRLIQERIEDADSWRFFTTAAPFNMEIILNLVEPGGPATVQLKITVDENELDSSVDDDL